MAKILCPACGAAHKGQANVCRLCGARLDGDNPITLGKQRQADPGIDPYSRRGMGPAILIGLGIVAVVAALAVGTGAVESTDQVNWLRDKLPFLKQETDDGWIEFADPDGVLVVETPGEPTLEEDPAAITPAGTVTSYVVLIGDDFDMTVGYTSGAGLDTAGNDREALEALAATFVADSGGREVSISDPFTYNGRPAIDVTIDGITRPKGSSFINVRILLVDGEAVFAETIGYTNNSDEHQRLADSIIVLGDDPQAAPPSTDPPAE
jgi:hypothetical protein